MMMKITKSNVLLEYELLSNFERVRNLLLNDRYADRLDKPLAYWAMPTDRRLPMAFMGRTLRDLLHTPFNALYATPGIGRKKIGSLVDLLGRAATEQLPGQSASIDQPAPEPTDGDLPASLPVSGGGVDAANVSEALWSVWRQTVVDCGLGREWLGRFAPSLQTLPRVIWCTPLDAYANLTLAEIRSLKTHGEKRVRSVLDVFGSLHQVLSRLGSPPAHLSVRVVPSMLAGIERWVVDRPAREDAPTADELREEFVEPLLRQIGTDAGLQTMRLAESRLGLDGRVVSVRQTARQMRLTRARIYQLLEDIELVIRVRWPDGGHQLLALQTMIEQPQASAETRRLFRAASELFFADVPQREPVGDSRPRVRLPAFAGSMLAESCAVLPA